MKPRVVKWGDCDAWKLICVPDKIPRLVRLGLTAEMSPAIWHSPMVQAAPHLMRWPFNEILAIGTHMTIGSDWI